MMLGTFAALTVALVVWRARVYAYVVALPGWVHAIGWLVIAAAMLFGFVADRQIGFHVRSFAPFFTPGERIQLQTGGVYGVVRHPIYASGIWCQIGIFLVTGYLAVAVACAVLGLGALWFTRQEERRLVELLADPSEYQRYRERVPALLPFRWRRPPAR